MGQTSGPLPPRPLPRLRLNGPDKHEQLKATRSRGGEGREEGGNVRGGGKRGDATRAASRSGTNNTEQRERVV